MSIHTRKPARSAVEARTPYTAYREELRADFHGCCGYCDDSDERADRISFHIDHFAPKTRFPELETDYANLVYACRFCNIHKSSKWVGNDAAQHNDGTIGFIDPCTPDYDAHLERGPNGRIGGRTDLGRHIVKELNLSLLRHELLWRARKARALQAEIYPLIERYKAAGLPRSDVYIDLLERAVALSQKIDRYELQAAHG